MGLKWKKEWVSREIDYVCNDADDDAYLIRSIALSTLCFTYSSTIVII